MLWVGPGTSDDVRRKSQLRTTSRRGNPCSLLLRPARMASGRDEGRAVPAVRVLQGPAVRAVERVYTAMWILTRTAASRQRETKVRQKAPGRVHDRKAAPHVAEDERGPDRISRMPRCTSSGPEPGHYGKRFR